jgi:predicted small integral membrane protein
VSKDQVSGQIERSYSTHFSEFITKMNTVPVKGKRRGFLPFDTNPFDRVFVSVILTIAVHLLWVRFLEEHVSLTVATILMLLVSAIIIARG